MAKLTHVNVRRRRIAASVVGSAMLVAVGHGPAVAAPVTAVKGSAFGYWADNIVLINAAQADVGPMPKVGLETDASDSPEHDTDETGIVKYGPAVIFTSDEIVVTSAGNVGENGSATSSSNISNVNQAVVTQFVETGSEIFTAANVASTCTASASGPPVGTTTLTGATLRTDSGWDTDEDGIFEPGEHFPEYEVPLPSPLPNHATSTYEGHIHIEDAPSGPVDSWRVVFNEQVTNPDGSLTVNAVHQYFLGPNLTGDLIIGQSVCGVS